MRERVLAAVLLSLPATYVAALLLPPVTAGAAAVPVGFALTIVIAGALVGTGGRGRAVALLVAAGLWVTLIAGFLGGSAAGAFPYDLTAGILLGLPWVATVHAWRPKESFGLRAIAFGSSTLFVLLDLATAQAVTGSGSALSGRAFVTTFVSTNVNEAQAIASLLAAGPLNPPVQSFFDPILALLTALALLGFLLLAIRPQTGEEAALPIALRATPPARSELPEAYGFSAEQRDAYRARSPDEPPGVPWPPGLDSVVVAAVAGAVFVGVALVTPYYAVLAATLGLAGAVGALLLVTERPAPFVPPEEPEPPDGRISPEVPAGELPVPPPPAAG